MSRMRTISQTLKFLREQDPDCAITEWALRNMLRTGKLKHHKAGNKYLINLDYLEVYLNTPMSEYVNKVDEYGMLRKVK